ncbi:MAG: hypothetical protein QGD91_12600 [Actinomycetota bacterium]|nr:hypothetical protein [Actinomycetota bacterium]
MIDYFDTYVRTKDGFVAVKDDLVAICDMRGIMKDTFQVCIYRNRQKNTRPIYYIGSGTRRWVRESTIDAMKGLHGKRIRVPLPPPQ